MSTEEADRLTDDGCSADKRAALSITAILHPGLDADAARSLEAFREEWEAIHGPTDLTKRYTSQLSREAQDFLCKHHPERYFEGLPAYCQEYFRTTALQIVKRGRMDDLPQPYLSLAISGYFARR